MKKINVLLLFLTLGLVVSCEKNESSKIYSFSGKAQKGPYVQGTNITIQELKSNLGQTGKSFTTFTTMGELATVITAEITDIASTSAISGGNVTNDGGADVTARGVVWSTSLEPTIDNNNGITSDGDGDGEFTSSITDLESETTYYVRAYATNNAGTAYGDQFSFTTLLESFCGTVTFTCRGVEVTYGTVEGQNGTCWLDRNLGASRIATAYNDSEAYGDLFQCGTPLINRTASKATKK